MRLAEHVEGTTDVDGMMETMSSAQFDEWFVKDSIEPIGYQTQLLSTIVWMLTCYLSDGKPDTKAEDWMPWLKHEPVVPRNSEAKQVLNAILGR